MKHIWVLLVLAIAVQAQSQSTKRLSEFSGSTVAEKETAAKAYCGNDYSGQRETHSLPKGLK